MRYLAKRKVGKMKNLRQNSETLNDIIKEYAPCFWTNEIKSLQYLQRSSRVRQFCNNFTTY